MNNEKILFSFDSLLSGKITMLNIINWGYPVGDKIEYENKDGRQLSTRQELKERYVTLCSLSDIDFESSLHWWHKNTKYAHSAKKVLIDETINTGEVYRGNCWRIGLMIQTDDNTIKVNPIFE